MKKNTKAIILVISLLITPMISGCIGGDKIGDILNNVGQYDGKEVNIRGDVTDILSVPFVSQGAYKISDGTGSIWIVTSSGTPEKGRTVSVKGTVRTAFTIASVSLGTIVFESKRS